MKLHRAYRYKLTFSLQVSLPIIYVLPLFLPSCLFPFLSHSFVSVSSLDPASTFNFHCNDTNLEYRLSSQLQIISVDGYVPYKFLQQTQFLPLISTAKILILSTSCLSNCKSSVSEGVLLTSFFNRLSFPFYFHCNDTYLEQDVSTTANHQCRRVCFLQISTFNFHCNNRYNIQYAVSTNSNHQCRRLCFLLNINIYNNKLIYYLAENRQMENNCI